MKYIEGGDFFKNSNFSSDHSLHPIVAFLKNRDDHKERIDMQRFYDVINETLPYDIKVKVLSVLEDFVEGE